MANSTVERFMKPTTKLLAISALAAATLLVGCSSEPSVSESARPSAAPAVVASATPREVIREGRLLMRTADPEKSEADVQKILDDVGGFILQSQLGKADGRSTLTMTVKVPVDRFGESLRRVAALGYVRSKSVTAQDITEKVAALKRQEADLRARPSDPSNQIQIGNVRQQISEVLATSGFSTIELTIEQETSLGKGQDDGWFKSEFGAAVASMGAVGRVVITIAVWLAVFSPLWASVGWGILTLVRWRERIKPPKLAV